MDDQAYWTRDCTICGEGECVCTYEETPSK